MRTPSLRQASVCCALVAITWLTDSHGAAQSPPARPAVVEPAVTEPRVEPERDPARRALFVVGDSTVKNHGPAEGWGDYVARYFDEMRIQALNWALDGRSSRSFIQEGRWQKVLAQMRAGDFVLVQFGHNDQRELTTNRGTIPAADDRSQAVVNPATGATGTVHSYGWYLRQYVRDVRAKDAQLVLISPAPRNRWKEDGAFDNDLHLHATFAREVAVLEGVPFIDLNARLARVYAALGREKVTAAFFTVGDSTHTNVAGAKAAAATVIDGLREAPVPALHAHLEPSALKPFADRPASWARGIEGQRKADLGNGYYLNPIVPGDRPDPSILKDGDEYYMTFSSFDAYPGLVIWHSRDLVNWRPITATLRENVGSVWAPDLVRHEGRYYIYFPARTASYRSNYVIWADDIRGPWSDPVDLKIGQIDPGHAVGPDGRRYLFMSAGHLVPLSADGLSVTGPMKKIYDGWPYPANWVVEGFAQEGPKIIRKGEYYYQVLAQGGTAGPPTGHMIVAARSKTIEGPWENSPYNPLLRTASSAERWWSKGHGTLVEGPDGRWWSVYHAYENGFYNLGRQTLLEPVEWLDDGWFRVAKYDPAHPIPKPVPESRGEHGFALSDDFSSDRMGIQWSFYKGTAEDRARYRYEDRKLVLKATGTSPSDSAPLWFVTGDHAYEIEVEIEAGPDATAGLLLFYNQRLYVGLGFSAKHLIMHSYGLKRPGNKPSHLGNHLHLRLRNDRHIVTIDYSVDGKRWERDDRGMEVSGYHHNVGYDFLSLRPALYAAGSGEVRCHRFKYRALP